MNSKTSLILKKFLITTLSVLLAVCMLFATACKEDDSSSNDDSSNSSSSTTTDTTESVTDYQLLSNGDFEFYTTDTTVYPYSSSIKWTRSTDANKSTAPASTGTSGIIDTEDSAYAKLDSKHKSSINPKTPYAYDLITNNYDKDDEKKRLNVQADGTKVLMIHNVVSSNPGGGTAQYFTSASTLNLTQNAYAKISVWINTVDLKSKQLNEGEYGAYVKIISTVNSVEYEDVMIKNIDTKGEWNLFECYVQGSEFSSTTFDIVFGLGEGNGTVHTNYVEGFAYFDNASYTVYNKKEFDALEKEDVINPLDIPQYNPDNKSYIDKDYKLTLSVGNTFDDTKKNADGRYVSNKILLSYASNEGLTLLPLANQSNFAFNKHVLENGSITWEDKNYIGNDTVTNVKANANIPQKAKDALNGIETDLGTGEHNLTYFVFDNEAGGTATYTTDTFTLGEDKIDNTSNKAYVRYTFYAKVNVYNDSIDQFKVEVIDLDATTKATKTKVAFSSFNTELVKEGNYGTWVKYDLFLSNTTDKAIDYQLKFTFGYDGETKLSQVYLGLTKGYAFIADLKTATVSEDDYTAITSAGNPMKINLLGVYSQYTESSESEETTNTNYQISIDHSQQTEIVTKPITNLGSNYIVNATTNTKFGVINSKYAENYGDNLYGTNVASGKTFLQGLQTDNNDNPLQLLALNNLTDTTSSYQLYRKTANANSITKITATVAVDGSNSAYLKILVREGNEYKVMTIKGDNDASFALETNVNSGDFTKLDKKFIDLTIYLQTGNKDVDYRVEVGNIGQGMVYISKILSDASDSTGFENKDSVNEDFTSIDTAYAFAKMEYTRATSIVTYTDENGNDATKERTYSPTVICQGNKMLKYASLATIDVENEIDERKKVETEDSDIDEIAPEEQEGTFVPTKNIGLEIVTIIISVVLLGVMITVFIRTSFKNKKRKIDTKKSYYDRDARDKAISAINDKKRKIDVSDDDSEYDYTLAEQVTEEPVSEEVIDLEEIQEAPIDSSEIVENPTSEDGETPTTSEDGETPTEQ